MEIEEVIFASGDAGTVLRSAREPDMSAFSAQERATLSRVAKQLGERTSRQLSDTSHSERAWTETPKGGMIPYELAKDMSL